MARQQDIQKLDAEYGQTVSNLPLLLVCVKAEEFRPAEKWQATAQGCKLGWSDIDVIAIFRIAPYPSSHRLLGGWPEDWKAGLVKKVFWPAAQGQGQECGQMPGLHVCRKLNFPGCSVYVQQHIPPRDAGLFRKLFVYKNADKSYCRWQFPI